VSLSTVQSAITICEKRAAIEALKTLPITYELALLEVPKHVKDILKEVEGT
jgi:hypothetical protein